MSLYKYSKLEKVYNKRYLDIQDFYKIDRLKYSDNLLRILYPGLDVELDLDRSEIYVNYTTFEAQYFHSSLRIMKKLDGTNEEGYYYINMIPERARIQSKGLRYDSNIQKIVQSAMKEGYKDYVRYAEKFTGSY